VVQEGGDVALRDWLAAAGDTMGGDALVGSMVFVFWYENICREGEH
jgi:hypothetical protein